MATIYKRRLCGNAAGDTIRLVDISPGPSGAPLECRLRYAVLGDMPVYDAISYCWGGQAPTVSIMCDGRPSKITQNLHDAFSTFRITDSTVTFWADALCINQKDNKEKSYQVSLMWKIFSQARQVRVWLGPDQGG
ncbi:heterokaryon incompatibility protein-domain-containing protein, partial [Lasiosphaeris hirsuta]